MLNELHIENIAVIEKADIEFAPGLNVLTGETGAGKSIIIDSIGAVLGERVGRDLVRRGAEKGLVTAAFELDRASEKWLGDNDIDADGELILQRRIGADGKNTCRICGTPVTAAQMKELAACLVDIHGQNDGRQLLDERMHMEYLDLFGELEDELGGYRREYEEYTSIKREIAQLNMDEIEKARLSESLKYQIDELERAKIVPGEQESLSSRRDLLRNAEKLTEAVDQAYQAIYGGDENALTLCQSAAVSAAKAAAIATELSAAATGIEDAVLSLNNASELLRDFRESLDFSPEEYDQLETRLSLLSKLERKYGRADAELLNYLDECRERLDNIQYADERVAKLKKKLAEQGAVCLQSAKRLSERRRSAAAALEEQIVTQLRELNMPSVRFSVEFAGLEGDNAFGSTGCDRLRFVMSANAGEELGRISRIASGGELSRIMLAMKNVFAARDPMGTMIFDEIDTGVSGIAAQRVAEKLFSVSLGKQVMCVTHLPQIAAMADSHYLISKSEQDGRTYTQVRRLELDGRKMELARMHGGDVITPTTLASAGEQLDAAQTFKNGLRA